MFTARHISFIRDRVMLAVLAIALSVSVVNAKPPHPDKAPPQDSQIEADLIECQTSQNRCTASGHANLIYQGSHMTGDTITAFRSPQQHQNKAPSFDRIEIKGHVDIRNPLGHAQCDHAVYNPSTKVLTLYGQKTCLKTRDGFVSAEDRIVYNQEKGTVRAQGQSILRHKDHVIRAHALTAQLDENQLIQSATAEEDVVLTTPRETASADLATYDARHHKVQLSHHTVMPHQTAQRVAISLNLKPYLDQRS